MLFSLEIRVGVDTMTNALSQQRPGCSLAPEVVAGVVGLTCIPPRVNLKLTTSTSGGLDWCMCI